MDNIELQKKDIIKYYKHMNTLHPKEIKLNNAIRDKKLEKIEKGLSPVLTFDNILAISRKVDRK